MGGSVPVRSSRPGSRTMGSRQMLKHRVTGPAEQGPCMAQVGKGEEACMGLLERFDSGVG